MRRGTNVLTKLLQLRGDSELHKKCLGELRGITDLERLKHDPLATSRDFRKHSLNCLPTIRSDVDRHMRLELRSVISLREILNEPLEITACWLTWNEPVSNNDLARHKVVDNLFAAAGVSPTRSLRSRHGCHYSRSIQP